MLFLLYTADGIEIARRHGITLNTYAGDKQLSIHTPASPYAAQIPLMTACIEELERWMSSNRLKLNTSKTQFMWLDSRRQVTKAQMQCQTPTLGGVEIKFCTEVICLVVVLDPELTFAVHIRRLSGKCFYHLRLLRPVRRALTMDAAKTVVRAFITSRVDYCNSVFGNASAAHLYQLQSVLHAATRVITRKRKYDQITATIRSATLSRAYTT